MADTKISALTGATTPLAGTEVVPVVQGGQTRKVSVADLTTGRAISATQLTLTTGNLIVSNGKGIDFSATPGTGTSELLADYEEGTWTPTIGLAAASPTVVYTNQVGRYTRIGNIIYFSAFVTTSTWTHTSTTNEFIMNLPFAPSTSPAQIASFSCALNFTKLNYTQITPYITTAFWGSSVIFAANGSGQPFDGIVALNVPSGTNIVLVVSGHYAV